MRWAWLTVLTLALAGCTPPQGAPQSGTVSKTLQAASGGSLELSGARLVIPAGALDRDTTVQLSVHEKPQGVTGDPITPSGAAVRVDLGGASLTQPAELTLPAVQKADPDYMAVEEWNGSLRTVRAGKVAGASTRAVGKQDTQGLVYSSTQFNKNSTYYLVAVAPFTRPDGEPLNVPFYWQAAGFWSTPTALAMMLNYFELGGYPQYANNTILPKCPSCSSTSWPGLYDIAWASGLYQTDKWPSEHLQDMGADSKYYLERLWDNSMIPGKFFESVVKLTNAGFNLFGQTFPPRPVLVSWLDGDFPLVRRAQVIVGSTDSTVWLNDPRDRWNGVHPFKTWAGFYNQKFFIQNDGGKLRTTVMANLVSKPQRGSLELAPLNNLEDANRTLLLRNSANQALSRWVWSYADGKYSGYFYGDEGIAQLTPDAELGRIIPISSRLEFSFNVVNLTAQTQTYTAALLLTGCPFLSSDPRCYQSGNVTVPAYSRAPVTLSFASLKNSLGPSASGQQWLEVSLHDATFTERHSIRFKVGPDGLAQVSILQPTDGATFKADAASGLYALTLRGSGQLGDGSALPAVQLRWSYTVAGDPTANLLGTGSSLTHSFPAGGYTLRLEGLDATGAVIATKTVSFSVTN